MIGNSNMFGALGMQLVDRGDPSSVDFSIGDLTADSAYHDLDLSAIVPAGAKFVLLYVNLKDDAAGKAIHFRKNGNSNQVAIGSCTTQVANVAHRNHIIIPLDAGRIIEYQMSTTVFTQCDIVVTGWWK